MKSSDSTIRSGQGSTVGSGFNVPLLTAGLVLLFAGSGWFSGATTVGLILVIVGALRLAFALVTLMLIIRGAGQ